MSTSGNIDARENESGRCELNRMISKSREEFIKEFEKYDEQKAKKIFIKVLNAIKNSVIDGDIDKLDGLSNAIDYISCVQNHQSVLQDVFNDDSINPLKNTNLIILTCEHNDVAVLQHIFSNNGSILQKLCKYSRRNNYPDYEDEMSHNAFYYAIRSGNVELLYTLLDWPDKFFDTRLDDLDRIISIAYEELTLKNVPLTDEMEVWVENKLISLRFYSNNSGQDKVNDLDNIKERIGFVLKNIDNLNRAYSNTDVDESFLCIIKFIAQNIHALKRTLKSTYRELPWEEMEFCLICFISSHMKRQEINLFCNALLPKDQLMFHLKVFAKELEEIKNDIIGNGISHLLKLPQKDRVELITDMINKNSQFKGLFKSYEQLRDIYSLQKMNKYINLAAKADPDERNGQLLIIRALQVTGELLKNTLESPNISNATSDYILLSVTKNTCKVISDLRNSLSHGQPLLKLTEIAENSDVGFFKGIQDDIKRIGELVFDILYSRKINMIKYLYEKIASSNNLDEIKDILRIFRNCVLEKTVQEDFITSEHKKLEELIEQLDNKIPDKKNEEKELLRKMKDIINLPENKSEKVKSHYYYVFKILKLMSIDADWAVNHNKFGSVKLLFEQELENMDPIMDFHYLKEIAELAERLLSKIMFRIFCDDLQISTFDVDKIVTLVYGIFHIAAFRSSDIQWIESLRKKLHQGRIRAFKKSNFRDEAKEKYNTLLQSKQLELKNILNRSSLSDISTKKISDYKNDQKLQAVIEILVLHILSILEILNYKLENDYLFLDDNYPLLTGRCLRNYLAHDNVFISLLLDPSIMVLLNAIKLTENIPMRSDRKLGKLVSDDSSKLKEKQKKSLEIISEKKQMFQALEDGSMESLKNSLIKGADLNARNIRAWTTFHFAAKGQNLETLKFILAQNLNADVKDIDGQNPIHIAAANGRTENVKYIIEEGIVCVATEDNFKNLPIHMAAMSGHKETFEFLFKNMIEIVSMYDDLSLEFAIQNNHIEIVKFLLKESESCYIQKNERGFVPLIEASEGGHLEIVELLLKENVDVNAKNKIKSTALHEAALNGHSDIANTLVSKGADVNVRDVEDCTPLHHAVRYNHEEVVRILLKQGAEVNAKHGIDLHTPLHLASQFGFVAILEILLKYHANVNAKMLNKFTPIHTAAENGHLEVVAILLKHGANITDQDQQERTPLYAAANKKQDKIVEFLIENGAKIDAKCFMNRTPLLAAVTNSHIPTVKLLLEKKADINAQDVDGNSVLHLAATLAEKDMIDFLIQNKAEINVKNKWNLTPLHMAVMEGRKDIADILIKNNVQVNDKCVANFTPLDIAIDKGHLEIVDLLIKNGAYIGATSLRSACMHNYKEIVSILISKGVDVNGDYGAPLFLAVVAGCSDIVHNLIEKGAKIHLTYSKENTLLHYAAKHGHDNIVNILITRGANIDSRNDESITPLYLAAYEGHADTVKILVDKGANVNIKSFEELSPLIAATQAGHNNVVEIILKNAVNCDIGDVFYRTVLGRAVALNHTEIAETVLQCNKIDVNFEENANRSVLHLASKTHNLKLVEILVDYGFDINVKNSDGAKPIHIAAKEGFKEAVEFFRKNGCSINDLDASNQTLLHYAVRNNHLAIVQYLVDQGADLNTKDIDELSPLHIAAGFGFKDIAEILLKSGAAYNATNKRNRKPLNMAKDKNVRNFLSSINTFYKCVKKNNLIEIKKYINSGIIVNVKNATKATPLHFAAWKGYNTVVHILLENNSNPNVKNYKGLTPLHYAVKFSHIKIVKHLLSHGAIFNVVPDIGRTPIGLSTEAGISNLLKFVGELFEKVKNRDPTIIDKLSNIKDIGTMRALMCTCNEGYETLTVLAMKEKLPEAEHFKEILQDGVSDLIDRAGMLLENGDYHQALDIFKSALEKRKKVLGPNNPGTLEIQFFIAVISYKQERYDEALSMLENISLKQKNSLGSNSSNVLRTRTLLAAVLLNLKRYEEAFNIFQEIYYMREAAVPNDIETFRVMNLLSIALVDQEQYEKALNITSTVFEKGKEIYGPDNPLVVDAQQNLARILNYQGKSQEALKYFKSILCKQGEVDALKTKLNIAEIYFKQQKYPKALEICQEVLKMQKSVLGSSYRETLIRPCLFLSRIFSGQGKHIAVLHLYDKYFDQVKDKLGETHPTVLEILGIKRDSKRKIKQTGLKTKEILSQIKEKFIKASKNGDILAVQRLLNGGADANDQDCDGRTPLHYAASKGHTDVVNILLKNGANVNQKDKDGLPPLHFAESNFHTDVANILMENGTNAK